MLKPAAFFLSLVLFCTLAACGGKPQNNIVEQKTHYTFLDDAGNTITTPYKTQKVVSLLGSYSELWISAGGVLAGATDDYSKNYGAPLPQQTQLVGSVKQPSLEIILGLAPDFVILSTDISSHRDIQENLQEAGIQVAFFKQESYQDYLRILKICTDILGAPAFYNRTEKTLTAQIQRVLDGLPTLETAPKVLLLRSMAAGVHVLGSDHATGAILGSLGAESIADKYPSLLKEMSPEIVLDENPDFILIVPMGDTEAANASFWSMVQSNPLWQGVSAIQSGNVHLLPKELFQLKPNARWGDSYEYLADILYGTQAY